MKRTCPFCKSELRKKDVFFCSSCGSILPENVQSQDFSMKTIREINPPVKFSTSLKLFIKESVKTAISKVKLKMLLMGIVVVAGLSVCFYFLAKAAIPKIDDRDTHQTTESINAQKETLVSNNTLSLNTSLANGTINQKKNTDYVPFDADFYSEFNGFGTLGSYFGFLSKDIGLLSKDYAKDFGPNYSIFARTKGNDFVWAVLLAPISPDLKMKEYGELFIEKVGTLVVVTKEKSLLEEVKSSQEGISKSLGLNSKFISIRVNLPVEGKALLINLSDGGNKIIDSMKLNTASSELKSIIEGYKGLNSNYLIVK